MHSSRHSEQPDQSTTDCSYRSTPRFSYGSRTDAFVVPTLYKLSSGFDQVNHHTAITWNYVDMLSRCMMNTPSRSGVSTKKKSRLTSTRTGSWFRVHALGPCILFRYPAAAAAAAAPRTRDCESCQFPVTPCQI